MNQNIPCIRPWDVKLHQRITEVREWILPFSWMITLKQNEIEITVMYNPLKKNWGIIASDSENIMYVDQFHINQYLLNIFTCSMK
jgi:hypothetical protein